MSDEPARKNSQSPLQRQDAHEERDDSGLAEITVATEYEARSESVRLLPVAGPPRRLVADALQRRNHSVGEREEKKEEKWRKYSDGNQMSTPARKSLSESRGVQLNKIELIHPGEFTAHRSATAPCELAEGPMIRDHQYRGPMTETPLGYSINESMPPMTANAQSTINITIRFTYPIVTLPEPYQKSESAPAGSFPTLVLPVQGGKLANAEFLLHEISKEFDLDVYYAQEALAVWMISDLLELQLKPHHSPYEVGCCWAHLLTKFTTAPEEEIREDRPAVIIKRRVQLSVRREQEIIAACPKIREILFNDAYEAFVLGRYNPSVEESSQLAGLAMSAVFEPYSTEKHNIEFLRQELESFVPRHLVSAIKGPLVFGRALSGPNSLESLLLKSWKGAPQTLCDVHMEFLNKLHDKPYYGAAFFPGAIERPKKKWSLSVGATDVQVLVGINETYITVLDENKKEILLVQRIADCSWDRIDPKPSPQVVIEPSLLLTFPDEDAKKRKSTMVVQIFGRQAVMMNALLRAMQEMAEEEEDSGTELSDEYSSSHSNAAYSSSVPSTSRTTNSVLSSSLGTNSSSPISTSPPKNDVMGAAAAAAAAGRKGSPAGSTVSRVPSITRHNKMCLASFDEAGKCLQAQGSLKVVFQVPSAV